MTLLFVEGFDHFVSDDHLIDKGWEIYSGYVAVHSNYKRFDTGNGVLLNHAGGYIIKTIDPNETTLYLGFAVKENSVYGLNYDVSRPFLNFKDEFDVDQVKVHLTTSNEVQVNDGTSALLGKSSQYVVPDHQWFYFEIKVTISATVGEVTARINGTQVLNLTSQNTKNGSDYIGKIKINGLDIVENTGFLTYIDDLYIDDAQFHGDCRVKTFFPDSDSGTHTDLVRSTGSNDYECVDDNPPNDDTDYISGNTPGDISAFGITTGALGTVIGTQLNNYMRKDDAGSRTGRPILRSNGADYNGITRDISADYYFHNDIWELDPDDSGAWTQTKLEAAEFGLEIVA